MTDKTEIFKQAAETQNWELLTDYIEPKSWQNLALDEREKLARLFYLQGLKLKEKSEDSLSLQESANAFDRALKIDPSNGDAWGQRGIVVFAKGILENNTELFDESNEMFQNAYQVFSAQGQALPVDLVFAWGILYLYMGRSSGEACDIRTAIEKFREANERGYAGIDYYYRYGSAIAELGILIGRTELIMEAIDSLEIAAEHEPSHGRVQLQLACAYKFLYILTHDKEYFEKAEASFSNAARLNSNSQVLWLKWAQLLAEEGKMQQDGDLLHASLEKFEKADVFAPSNPQVIVSWADALMNMGSIEENLEPIKEAQELLTGLLTSITDSADLWATYGHCLIHLGKYFTDPATLQTSIEKFQQALTLDSKAPHLWHGLATAHFALGEMREDPQMIEKAVRLIAQSMELGGDIHPQYWNDWGVALMKLSELKEDLRHIPLAADKFEQAISRYTNTKSGAPDPEWYYNYGCALDYLGDFYTNPTFYEKAVNILSQVCAQDPAYHHAKYNLALALYHLGDSTGDIESLDKSLALFEELFHAEPEDDFLCNDYGVTLLTLADIVQDSIRQDDTKVLFDKAEQMLMQALALGNRQSNYFLACLHSLKENYPDAMHYIEKAKIVGALPAIDDILHDEWLEGLKQTAPFKEFISSLHLDEPL